VKIEVVVRCPDGIDASLIYVQSNTCKNPDHRHNRGGLPYRLVAQIRQLFVSSCREVKLVSTTTGVQPHQSSARGGARRAGPRSPRDRILSSQDRFWRTNQISGPESTVQHLLAELTRADELVRVRKGLYWRGQSTPLGMSPPPVELLLSELVGTRGVGPSGVSAANLLRLSTQIPRFHEIAVPCRPPVNTGPVKFVSRASRTRRRTARLTASEVALLETLDGWDRVIEIPMDEAWIRMRDLVASEQVSPTRLAQAAKTEPASVRARLAALLIAAGAPESAEAVPRTDPRTKSLALPAAFSFATSRP
jgi:hypothetical protein